MAKAVNRRGGNRRRRPGRADCRNRVGGGRYRDRADRAPPGRRSSHHGAAFGFGHRTGDAWRVWARMRRSCAPLRVMRIVDATARLVRAPEVSFAASEIDLDAFGHNIENRHLMAALDTRRPRRTASSLIRFEDDAIAIDIGDERCDRLTIGPADQSSARARRSAPTARRSDLPRRRVHRDRWPDLSADRAHIQSLAHARPAPRHLDRIPHRERTVHAFGCRCPGQPVEPGLPVVRAWRRALRIAALDDATLNGEIEQRCHSIRSASSRSSPARGRFPHRHRDGGERFGAHRIALIGEEPPDGPRRIGAQEPESRACATPPRSARSWCRHAATATTSARQILWRATTRLRRAEVAEEAAPLAVDLLNRTRYVRLFTGPKRARHWASTADRPDRAAAARCASRRVSPAASHGPT